MEIRKECNNILLQMGVQIVFMDRKTIELKEHR